MGRRLSERLGRRGLSVLVAVGLLVLLAVSYAGIFRALRADTPGRQVSLSELNRLIDEGAIADIALLAEDDRLLGRTGADPFWVALGDNDVLQTTLLSRLSQNGVPTRIDAQESKARLRQASQYLLPGVTLFVGLALVYTFFRGFHSGGELGGMARSAARRHGQGPDRPTTFADVAGAEEAVAELAEISTFLAEPARFEALGAKPPKGVLLMGPPGCGKTLLARAVAGEAGVPFFALSASEFVEMLMGVGPARVRDLFARARRQAPSIIFIDEIDSIGRARAAGETFNAEGESTLNELLVQLDGFGPDERVVLIAATNRPDILDSALVRKGRFDRHIVVDAPALEGRTAIFELHAADKPLAPEVALEALARRTPGFTGADIAATMNEAAILAARRRSATIGNAEISEAIDRVLSGPERHSSILAPAEKRRVACHEAGHVVAGWVLGADHRVEKVSIVARGHTLGATQHLPSGDSRIMTQSQLEAQVAVLLAGRAAERLVHGEVSSLAQDDTRRATELVRRMVCELGMTDAPGGVTVTGVDGGAGAAAAEAQILEAIRRGEALATSTLAARRQALTDLVDRLVVVETLERPELESILGATGGAPPSHPVVSGTARL